MGFLSTYIEIVIKRSIRNRINVLYEKLCELSYTEEKDQYSEYPYFILYAEMPSITPNYPTDNSNYNTDQATISLEFIKKYRTIDIE